MDKPFGSSTIERDVRRIVTNPFSESPSVFVPDEECVKLQKTLLETQGLLVEIFMDFANADYELKRRCRKTFMVVTRYLPRLQELGIEVAEK